MTTPDTTLDLTQLVRDARADATARIVHVPAAREIGDHGLAFLVPTGYEVQVLDRRDCDDFPARIVGDYPFVGVESFAAYIDRYHTEDTVTYVRDVYGRGWEMLTGDQKVAWVVFDDHPAAEGDLAADHGNWRQHVARLVLRPTTAARRWGAAIAAARVDQEQFLDLVVDGISEIAEPDGATLRDVVGNLHAIRRTDVKQVTRMNGETAIELAENVQLSAGTGNRVTFPETIKIILTPYAAVPDTITVDVRVKPRVHQDHVTFELSAPALDDELARIVGSVAAGIAQRTGIAPLWTP